MSILHIPQVTELATRTYWDVFGAETESLDINQKILYLGIFVQNGGHISDVVQVYVDGRDNESQLDAVQWAIFHYLEYMINARESLQPYKYAPTALRIMRLEKEELLELLEKELLRCVVQDPDDYRYVITGIGSPNDVNLDAIERRHWRSHPEESFTSYCNKSCRWDSTRPGLWRK